MLQSSIFFNCKRALLTPRNLSDVFHFKNFQEIILIAFKQKQWNLIKVFHIEDLIQQIIKMALIFTCQNYSSLPNVFLFSSIFTIFNFWITLFSKILQVSHPDISAGLVIRVTRASIWKVFIKFGWYGEKLTSATVITLSSGICQAVFRQLSNCHLVAIC